MLSHVLDVGHQDTSIVIEIERMTVQLEFQIAVRPFRSPDRYKQI